MVPSLSPSASQQASAPPISRAFALLLALLATCTSIWIAVIAGWDRGGQLGERLAWVLIGLVLLLGAHLIPALCSRASPLVRVPALCIWLVSMAATGYGHATFFVLAQQHSGALRAAALRSDFAAPVPIAGRTPADVAMERAKVTRDLARVNAQTCEQRCAGLRVTRTALTAKLAALDVEFGEATRRERLADDARAQQERFEARVDAARIDPVTARIAQTFGVATGTVDLCLALSFGLLLECVACIGWLLALREGSASGNGSRNATTGLAVPPIADAADAAPAYSDVVAASQPTACSPMQATGKTGTESETSPSADLARVEAAVEAGDIRLTVMEIRGFLRCSQSRALKMRRHLMSRPSLERLVPQGTPASVMTH
ncbi:hypothetical protein [Paraburkholderia flagellata]|uniref:hypothetical protein n=1 Tax=Paraburkholderia flagellata TaxID=2883241 RepID=UPI001F267111|nr:hypothetical protein [Paraburkholderia flagellata]